MKTLTLLSGAVCGALLASAPALQAAPLTFLNRTITANIHAKDLPNFRSAVGEVLNQGADQATTTWQSQHGNPGRPITVALTPRQTVQAQATRCRLLDAQVQQGQASERWQYWFCQQPDGGWKASTQP